MPTEATSGWHISHLKKKKKEREEKKETKKTYQASRVAYTRLLMCQQRQQVGGIFRVELKPEFSPECGSGLSDLVNLIKTGNLREGEGRDE